MDNKKFEKLIDLIINENEDQARALFHDIVVEKSREIYESMMDEELDEGTEEDLEEGTEEELEEGTEEELEEGFGEEGGHGDEVGGLLDEIDAEEQGMTEEDDEFADIDMDDSMDGEEAPEGDIEDRVVELEDKLDELMAEFEEMMGGDEGGEEDFGGEEDMGGEEDFGGEEEEEEQGMMEAVQLQKVSVTHGDNGVNTKSVTSNGPKIPSNGAKANHLGGSDGGKGGTQGGLLNPAVKDIPGNYKNAPGKGNFSEKGEAAPKPAKGDNGVNSKSITSESRKMVKKPLTKTVAKKIVK